MQMNATDRVHEQTMSLRLAMKCLRSNHQSHLSDKMFTIKWNVIYSQCCSSQTSECHKTIHQTTIVCGVTHSASSCALHTLLAHANFHFILELFPRFTSHILRTTSSHHTLALICNGTDILHFGIRTSVSSPMRQVSWETGGNKVLLIMLEGNPE